MIEKPLVASARQAGKGRQAARDRAASEWLPSKSRPPLLSLVAPFDSPACSHPPNFIDDNHNFIDKWKYSRIRRRTTVVTLLCPVSRRRPVIRVRS